MKMFGLKSVLAAGVLALVASASSASTMTCPEPAEGDGVDRYLTLNWNEGSYDATLECLNSGYGTPQNAANVWLDSNGWAKIGEFTKDENPSGLAGVISATAGSLLYTGLAGSIELIDPGTYDTYALLWKFGGTKVADNWFIVQITFQEAVDLILNWTQNGQNDLSHTSLWGMDPTTVPLPAGGLLLLTALGGVALVRRRKLVLA